MNFLSRNNIMSMSMGGQRGYSRSATLTAADATTPGGQATPPKNGAILEGPRTIPTKLDKIFLRWSGQIKKGETIPTNMPGTAILRARSFARIRINIGFLVLGAIMSGVMIYSGKQALKRGDSIEKRNLEWHRQVKEDYEKELAVAATNNNNKKK